MGVEYALVDEATREAFDLGKGPWGAWTREMDGLPSPPLSAEAIEGLVFPWLRGDADEYGALSPDQASYMQWLIPKILGFVERHPNARVVSDGYYAWWSNPSLEDRQDPDVFVQVGSRYDWWSKSSENAASTESETPDSKKKT